MKRKQRLLATRRDILVAAGSATLAAACSRLPSPASGTGESAERQTDVVDTMKRATEFMRERCAVKGGYVWSYAADFSRRWGEMEAYPSMIWIQPPGTATVGHLYLDCYHATADEYYYDAAVEVAQSLIAAQHGSGGWNYLHDFAGEASTRRWYDTVGKNGWRLEEFHYYYGNATFDDAGTSEASQFLLRMALEKQDKRFTTALKKAIRFVIDSQYDNGGWPQRFPLVNDTPELHERPDYTRYITFNDDVPAQNIKFLLMVWQSLGDREVREAINKAMDIFVATQQAAPQAAWGLQHTLGNLAPAGARSYEPVALVTSTTASNVSLMLDFYEWTGRAQFLERLPEAIDWLASVRLTGSDIRMPGREFPTFVEIGTNRALINHRRGSNVWNGEYYQDYNPDTPISHYSQWRGIDLDGLRDRYENLRAAPPQEVTARSPLNRRPDFVLPRFFAMKPIEVPDLFSNGKLAVSGSPDPARVAELVSSLNEEGYWPTPLTDVSNPYIGDGSATVAAGDFAETLVGDASDTSPYLTGSPAHGISIRSYIQNMNTLMQAAMANS